MKKWGMALIFIVCFVEVKAPVLWESFLEFRREFEVIKYLPFSEERMARYIEMKYSDFMYTDYLLRQARLETGHYTSPIFREGNNLFGMKHPRVRETLSKGSKRGHAYFEHWTESVDDYMLWYKYYERLVGDCYYQFLNRVGYAEDKRYISKLKLV